MLIVQSPQGFCYIVLLLDSFFNNLLYIILLIIFSDVIMADVNTRSGIAVIQKWMAFFVNSTKKGAHKTKKGCTQNEKGCTHKCTLKKIKTFPLKRSVTIQKERY